MTEKRHVELSSKDRAVLNGPELDAQLKILCSFYAKLSEEQKDQLIQALSDFGAKSENFFNIMYSMRPAVSRDKSREEPSENEWRMRDHN